MPRGAPKKIEDTAAQKDRKRISRPHDARAVRSRAALGVALLDLIDRRDFGRITIKDITEQAGVSYPVFFRQFASTEELLADVATQQVRNLIGYTNEAFNPKSDGQLEQMCSYVAKHRKLWKTLLSAGASTAMRKEFSRISAEVRQTRPRANPALPVDLVTDLVTNAIFDILTWWMKQPEEYPTRNIVKLLDVLVVRTYTMPIKVDLE